MSFLFRRRRRRRRLFTTICPPTTATETQRCCYYWYFHSFLFFFARLVLLDLSPRDRPVPGEHFSTTKETVARRQAVCLYSCCANSRRPPAHNVMVYIYIYTRTTIIPHAYIRYYILCISKLTVQSFRGGKKHVSSESDNTNCSGRGPAQLLP